LCVAYNLAAMELWDDQAWLFRARLWSG
jgi:hypothetical protein